MNIDIEINKITSMLSSIPMLLNTMQIKNIMLDTVQSF